MDFTRQSKRLSLLAAALFCIAVVIFCCPGTDQDSEQKQNGTPNISPAWDTMTFESCSEIPDELQVLLNRFPEYAGRRHCANAFAGFSTIATAWRLDDATKEMFEFALTNNHLVEVQYAEVDENFWDVPIPWWTPDFPEGLLCAAWDRDNDIRIEGLHTVLIFDTKNKVFYGLTVFNL